MIKIVIKESNRKLGCLRYWFHIKSKNGKILAHSEIYNSKRAVKHAVDLIISAGYRELISVEGLSK